jgi:hypothetical protein
MAETRVWFRGKRLNKRTVAMLLEAERRLGYKFSIIQGSYNAGGVSASAGTHDGGGALDIWGKGGDHVWGELKVLRSVGFAIWHRTPAQGNWGHHMHGLAIGDDDLSSGARNQVTAYKNGRNGLASNRADDGPDGYRSMTWEKYLEQHPEARPVDPNAPLLDASVLAAQTLNDLADRQGRPHKYRLNATQQRQIATNRRTIQILLSRKRVKYDPRWSTLALVQLFQRHYMGYRKPTGIANTATAKKLSQWGYRYQA